ncbi:MAG TPA: 16S rRNA processing protein RimM [Desulfonatronum sp.]|nr:16S rRNA processing protein RimM [Desulfonatronum sp.]
MSRQPLIVVGKVIKPHGLAGEFSIVSYVDSPDFFDHVARLYLRINSQARPRRVRVQSWRVHNSKVLITLEQVTGRHEAELLRGGELLAREADMPTRQEGEIYQRELIDAKVFLPSGVLLGRIQAVSEAGGQELWSIQTEQGREVLFPAHERLVLEIDLENNAVRIDPPPGLLELYLT